MSLNGLDGQEVQAAYNAAIAEGAGWFLLKYTARDAVDLLAQGRGGVSEARNAISEYHEKSPLYGLLMYRRRRFLIKYVPEGTSRLLQVRTNVHLQDVLEKYSPYETLFEIASADALSDTSLANSFPMHVAAASPSPSGGRLDEIHEDEDEEPGEAKEQLSGTTTSGRLSSAQRHKPSRRTDNMASRAERAERLASILNTGRTSRIPPLAAVLDPPTAQAKAPPAEGDEEKRKQLESPTPVAPSREIVPERKETLASSAINNPPSVASPSIAEPLRFSDDKATPKLIQTNSAAPSASMAPKKISERTRMSEDIARPSVDRPSNRERTSSMSSRPFSLDEDPYDLSKYDELFKPKVKLGPRPVSTLDKTKRAPRVSAVPASFKSALKKADTSRPSSRASTTAPPTPRTIPSPAPPPPPALSPPAHIAPPIPPTPDSETRPISRSSVKSTASHRSQGMTPDKLRLMKALDFRKRQMRKSKQQNGDVEPIIDEKTPSMPTPPAAATEQEESGQIPIASPEMERLEDATSSGHHAQSSKADSGIEMQYDQAEDKLSEMDEIAEDEDRTSPRDKKPEISSLEGSPEKLASGEDQADSVFERDQHVDNRTVSPVSELEEDSAVDGAKGEDLAIVPTIQDDQGSHQPWLNTSAEDVKEEQRVDSHDDSFSSVGSQTSTAHPDSVERFDASSMAVAKTTTAVASRLAASDVQSGTAAAPSRIASSISSASSIDLLEEKTSRPDSGEVTKHKRRGVVNPLDLDSSRSSTIGGFSSDDEFLEELHSATVEEARPVQVARSPISPLNGGFNFSNQQNIDETASVRSVKIHRTSSHQKRMEDGEQPSPQLARSISVVGRASPTPTPEKMDLAAKMARNVSSGISRRIQALNQSTSKEASPSAYSMQSHPLTPEGSPNSFLQHDHSDRKLPLRMPSNRRLSSKFNSISSRDGTPTLEKGPFWSVQHDPKTNNPSVSVTTRIVRPQQEPDEASLSHLGLSPREETFQSLPEIPRPGSTAQSSTSTPPLSPATTGSGDYRTLHSATSSRFNRRKKVIAPEDTSSKGSRRSSSAISFNDENVPLEKGSKTSRFFKRVSALGGGAKRKSVAQSVASSTSGQGPLRESLTPDMSDMPPAVVVGDLNVQFPDSLLWKRRIVSIDEVGSLQFSPTQGSIRSGSLHIASPMMPSMPFTATNPDPNLRGGISTRRFSLADFKVPSVPDLEIQELPHSVLLEFPDGTSLQLACEDAMTQRQVLHLLKSYWKSWAAVA